MKRIAFVILLAVQIIVLVGCSTKNESLEKMEKELLAEKSVIIYALPSNGIHPMNEWTYYDLFKKFPFVSPQASFEYKGKFLPNFYDDINGSWKAVGLDKVDWQRLSETPASYDIIHIQSMGISSAGKLENDFMMNVSKAYNISSSNMKLLRQWVENGGVLWCEAGLWTSRFETFYPSGGIDDAKTMSLFSKEGSSIFGLPVSHRVFHSASSDMVNYETNTLKLKAAASASQLTGIEKVIFKPTSFIESYPILNATPLLVDEKGSSYASYALFGKGMIITMVPSQYWNAEEDGELFRWKLLGWVLERKGQKIFPSIK
ncbi:hypothetical protein [Sulfuricurvum sp.]|uniref:hypothetical protein n=1 Tax=Sulfuricurvum sp. TaxID=2025608 RepID=UPI003BB77420